VIATAVVVVVVVNSPGSETVVDFVVVVGVG